jgi:hypothetical protein
MSWEDITTGQRADPEHRRNRVKMSPYWQETCEMFECGWQHFWKKLHKDERGNWRRMDPPTDIGRVLLDSEYNYDPDSSPLFVNSRERGTKRRENNA